MLDITVLSITILMTLLIPLPAPTQTSLLLEEHGRGKEFEVSATGDMRVGVV